MNSNRRADVAVERTPLQLRFNLLVKRIFLVLGLVCQISKLTTIPSNLTIFSSDII